MPLIIGHGVSPCLSPTSAGLVLPVSGVDWWVRGDRGITLNGSNVSQWDDLSGNGNHLIQSTAINQPLFVSSGINGKPSVDFDGANHHMIADAVSSIFNGTDRPYTFFGVFEKAVTSGRDTMIGVGSSLAGTPFIRHAVQDTAGSDRIDSNIRDDVALNVSANSNVFTKGSPHFATLAHSGTQMQMYVDGGIDLSTPFDVGQITIDRFTVGALRRRDADAIIDYFDGMIGELILFGRLLNGTELASMHAYLSS